MPKIIHYRDSCIGCNSCVEHMSNNWGICKKDGKATLKNSKIKGKTHIAEIDITELAENEKAAEDCPMGIIKIIK